MVNIFGAAVLGIPLCWVVLMRGMWEKSSAINGPLLNFEVSCKVALAYMSNI